MEKKKKNVRNIKSWIADCLILLGRFIVACTKHPKVLIDSIKAFDAFVSIHV
jgi:hypothetical protein